MNKIPFVMVISLILSACLASRMITIEPVTAAPSTHLPSPTFLSISPTPVASTALNYPSIIVSCLDVAATLPLGKIDSGKMVAIDPLAERIYLIDPTTENMIPLENGKVSHLLISSNYQWMAYLLPTEELVVRTANGKERYQFSATNIKSLRQWIGDERLLAVPVSWPHNDALLVINPFTGEQKELIENYPGLIDADFNLRGGWIDWSERVVYNSLLTKAVYLKFFAERPGVALWDVETHSELALFEMPGYGKYPKWSPDNQRLAILLHPRLNYDDFFILDLDGSSTRLTYLAEPEYYAPTIIHKSYTWSSDGRYIAFWMSRRPDRPFTELRLGIVDTLSGQTTDYCDLGNTTSVEEPVWLPDGTQLLLGTIDASGRPHIVLLDILEKQAYHVVEGFLPLGWLVP